VDIYITDILIILIIATMIATDIIINNTGDIIIMTDGIIKVDDIDRMAFKSK